MNAERLVMQAERDEVGALWFAYHYPHRYDVTVPVPWWSSMGQGQPLSLFCRLAQLHPEDRRWRELADATFRTFDGWRALGRPWVTTMDAHGCLWFEEYAGDVEPLPVVNGHIFAMYGLYDYAMLTGDQHAIDLFDGGPPRSGNTSIRFAHLAAFPTIAHAKGTASALSGKTPGIIRSTFSNYACSRR